MDSDTLIVDYDDGQRRGRLLNIDAPETRRRRPPRPPAGESMTTAHPGRLTVVC